MNRKIFYFSLFSASLLLLMTGCENHRTSSNSSSKSSITTTKKVESKSSYKSKIEPVDDKTLGVMVSLVAQPSWFKDFINQGELYYGRNHPGDENLKGYNYITANGDPTSFVYYKSNNNQVTYKVWVPSAKSVADGHLKSSTVSLNKLENEYYSSRSQKSEIINYANKLKPEESYESSLKQRDSTSSSVSSSDTSTSESNNSSNITAENFSDWALGAYITPDLGGSWENPDAFELKSTNENIKEDGIDFQYIATITDENAGTDDAQIQGDEEIGLGKDGKIYLNSGSGFVQNEKFTSAFDDNFHQ
ncbi:MAG: hypothetical protein ABF695_12235 [Liquorilactobacillus ghanensis]|uniref:Lreu_0056 family protein n=1 Tax=Liquorilactobacillus ghanensis TaxID=399370 RepID=UPI0039E823A6